MMESAGGPHHLAQWEVMIDIFIWWQPSGGQKLLLRRFTPKLWRKWKIADLINVSLNPDQTQLIQMYGLSMFNLLFIPSLPYISSSLPHFYGTSQSSSATPKKTICWETKCTIEKNPHNNRLLGAQGPHGTPPSIRDAAWCKYCSFLTFKKKGGGVKPLRRKRRKNECKFIKSFWHRIDTKLA